MRSTEHFETLFNNYYGHVLLYAKWYTVDPALQSEIIEKTFAKYKSAVNDSPQLPSVHLHQLAREVAVDLIKDIRPSVQETERRLLLFSFLGSVSVQDRDLYLERFYRNASDKEISEKFEVSEERVLQTIRRIAVLHANNLNAPNLYWQ